MNLSRIHKLINDRILEGEKLEFYGGRTEDEICAVEHSLKLSFPIEYREFLKEFGGGGTLNAPISGIYPGRPFDLGAGSVYGDTIRARNDQALPPHYFVVHRDDDIFALWIVDSESASPSSVSPVFSFPFPKEARAVKVADSIESLLCQYFGG